MLDLLYITCPWPESARSCLAKAVSSVGRRYVQLEVHCTDLLNNWSKITGNDPSVPWAYYFRLLRSISFGSDGSKLNALHQWMAAKVAEQDPVLVPPAPFIPRIRGGYGAGRQPRPPSRPPASATASKSSAANMENNSAIFQWIGSMGQRLKRITH